MVLGVKGTIVDGWEYDANYQYSMVNLSETYLNDLSKTKIQNSLLVDPATGQCTSVINGSDPNCVPWNIFQPGGVTSAATQLSRDPGSAERPGYADTGER